MFCRIFGIFSFLLLISGQSVTAQDNPYAPMEIPPENWLSLEAMLQIAGYPTGPVDGEFDVISRQSLGAFWDESGRKRTYGTDLIFTKEAYLELYALATAIKAGEVTELRPNWKIRSWEIHAALRRIGCAPQSDGMLEPDVRSRALRCYKIHKGISPAIPTMDGIDTRELILEAANGPDVDLATYEASGRSEDQAASGPTAANMTPVMDPYGSRPLVFGSGMRGKVYTNLHKRPHDCKAPELSFVADLSSTPHRGAIESLLYKIDRTIWSDALPCPGLERIRLTLFSEGQKLLDVPFRLRDRDGGKNHERFSVGAGQIYGAWTAAQKGEFEPRPERLGEDAFLATLRNPDLMLSLRFGTFPPDGTSRELQDAMIYAWRRFVNAFEYYCIDGNVDDLTELEREILSLSNILDTGAVVSTRKNVRTGLEWEKWRVKMKGKYTDIYLALVDGKITAKPFFGELGQMQGIGADFGDIIQHYRCQQPGLLTFEDNLTEAALRPYDWRPNKVD